MSLYLHNVGCAQAHSRVAMRHELLQSQVTDGTIQYIYIYILSLASKSFSKKCFTLVPKNNETKRKSIHLGLLIADC